MKDTIKFNFIIIYNIKDSNIGIVILDNYNIFFFWKIKSNQIFN